MNHSFVTAALPFDAARAHDVMKLLDGMGNPAKAGIAARLDDTNCVHFMGINILPGDDGRAHLIIDASVDGGPDTGLDRLETAIGNELHALFTAAGNDLGTQSVAGTLARRLIKVNNGWFANPGLDFDGAPRISVKQIKDEARLATRIAGMLDKPLLDATAMATLQRIRAVLWNDMADKWAFFAEPAPFLRGVPPAPRLTFKSVSSALARFLWPVLLLGALVGGLVWWLCGLDAGVGVGLLTFVAALLLRGAPPPDRVTESVIWLAVEMLFWPFLLVTAIAGGLTWWFAGLGWAAVACIATLAVELLLLFAGYRVFRRMEETDVPEDLAPHAELVQAMMERESYTAQNLLAAASTVKPGMIRRVTLRFGLAAAGVAALFYSRPGFLTDIGVIHFARWFCLPGTDKLMFFSNYDGAWESYLEDFIERGFRGVTGIWSNTVGFPKTSGLLNGGARDGDRLRRWTRRQMFPARFWYTAYPRLTLSRIRINAEIRHGLATAQTEAQASAWLALFGAVSRPVERVDRPGPRLTQPLAPVPIAEKPAANIDSVDVPTLLFGSLSHLRFGTALLVRLVPGSARNWLRHVSDLVTFGSQREAETAFVLGLSCSGLEKLGLGQDELATFPVPFQHGNHAPWRARAIGDAGRNAPDQWSWGAPHASVDVAIMIYARDQPLLDAFAAARMQEITQFGHTIVHQIRFRELPADDSVRATEPFGYVDGVSQPIIRGMRGDVPTGQSHQVVEPGEFILGYPDNQGYVPPMPTVPACDDPQDLLPPAPAGRPPDEAGAEQREARRDLGRNGTFLVVRQLEQDVEAFTGFLRQEAAKLVGDPRVPALDAVTVEDWLGAKIVGRWKDGSSLVGNPHCPGAGLAGARPDNDFTYGTNDASGQSCPLGAHIRRANPRDSFEANSESQLAITNRHRILRVGRSYAAQNGRKNPGLMFMCVNVDIERQFEFVQHTWLLARSFHGLEDESDAVLGGRGAQNVFTIPTVSGPLRIRGMSEFITVLGGGYFFLPGRHALRYLAR